jgi:diketogulonate reductase-like aldo/keto reductase
LEKLGLDHVDLYLIHWPTSFFEKDEKNRVPMHKLWASLEKLVDQGLTKSLGLCNCNIQLVADLLLYCRIKPVANQIELHPLLA